jgi:hypothetical protein
VIRRRERAVTVRSWQEPASSNRVCGRLPFVIRVEPGDEEKGVRMNQEDSAMVRALRVVGAALVALLASCATVPPGTVGVAPRIASPEPWRQRYEALAQGGAPVLQVDAARSVVAIEVRRGGRLAKLGHDHVVASHDVRGFIAPTEGRADVSIVLRDLVVDEPALRQKAGFDTQPSAADIEGTRANMLNRVLRVDEHPFVFVALTGVRAASKPFTVEPLVTLNGVTRPVPAEIAVETMPAGMKVTGRMTILQTDFALVPLSILGGALEVRDGLAIDFEIVARPAFR